DDSADGKAPRESPIDGQEDAGRPRPAQSLTAFLRSAGIDAYAIRQRRVAQGQAPPVPRASHALTGDRIELCDLDGCDAARERTFHNGASQGMLARALQPRRAGEDEGLLKRPAGDHLAQRRPAARKRPRLINTERTR